MEISTNSLKTLIEYCRYPAVIFDLDVNLLVSNAIFNYNYLFDNEKKQLKLNGKSEQFNFLEVDTFNIKDILKPSEQEEYTIILGGLLVGVKSLQNENKKVIGWILTINQTFAENEKSSLPINENKFHFLAEHMPQIVWITNRDGCLDYCNKRWEDYTGLTFEETVAGKWAALIHPDDLPLVSASWEKAFTFKDIYDIEFRIQRASDGMYRWHLVRGFPIKNEQEELLAWFGTSTDIDDLKKAEETLRKSEKRYHTLIQSLHSVYWKVSAEGAVFERQPSWEAFSGQTWEEYKDFGWIAAIHPQDRQELLAAWNEAILSVKIYQHVARFWSKEKKDYIYCIARAAPLLDDKGNLIKWIGSCLDIHQQILTEKTLQEVTEQLNLALSSANIGIWNRDLINDTVVWNSTMYALFDIESSAHPLGHGGFINLLHPHDQQRVVEEIKKLKESNVHYFDMEFRVIWKDDSIHILVSRGKIYRDKTGKPINMIGICLDVTENKLAQQLLHRHQLELEKEEKASSVAEIASTLAHELTQPLAAIATFTQGCIQQLEKNQFRVDDILYALTESTKQVERAGKIIHRIKNSVRKKALYIEPVNLSALIKESIQFATYGINNINISVNYQVCTRIPILQIDKIQIQQVIINLIRNSIEALTDFEKINPEIIVSAFLINDFLLTIEIIDNGPGFSQIHLQDLKTFDSNKDGGMGIGLSICRSIIEAHGGKLVLTNVPMSGAAVQFSLPIMME